jgi:two-component system sensor histidine kinase UhpB
MQQTRNLIKRLSLSIIDDLGIEDALVDLIKNWSRRTPCKNINVNVDLPNSRIFKSQLNETVYRLTQEALTNMSKHSRPKEVLISIQRNDNVIHLSFMNNGLLKRTKKTRWYWNFGYARKGEIICQDLSNKAFTKVFIKLK